MLLQMKSDSSFGLVKNGLTYMTNIIEGGNLKMLYIWWLKDLSSVFSLSVQGLMDLSSYNGNFFR